MPPRPIELTDTLLSTEKKTPLPKENLDVPTQEKIQELVDETLLHIFDHLGIPRGLAPHIQETLLHLNKMNTGNFVDKEQQKYSDYFKKEVKPLMKQLEDDVQGVVSTDNWVVQANRGYVVGDMVHIVLKNKVREFQLSIYGRGFEVETPDFGAQLNIYPPGSESDPSWRSLNTGITVYQRGNSLDLPAPILKIQSEAHITGEGPLQYMITDTARNGEKPNVFEILGPKTLTSQVAYSAKGVPQSLKLTFTLPQTRGLENTVNALFDLRDLAAGTKKEIEPNSAYIGLGGDTFELSVFPEISINDSELSVSFLGKKDTFRLQTQGVVATTETLTKALKNHFY